MLLPERRRRTPATLLKWLNRDEKQKGEQKAIDPQSQPTPDDVRASIVRIATDNGEGFTRIRGELRKLGIRLSHQTVKFILKERGFDHLDETVTFANLRKAAAIAKVSRSF